MVLKLKWGSKSIEQNRIKRPDRLEVRTPAPKSRAMDIMKGVYIARIILSLSF